MFQLHRWTTWLRAVLNLAGKRAWHEHHLSRKKCRVRMRRQYIIDASWTVYEQETWNRSNEIVGNPDVTVEDVEAFVLEAILSVNKNEIVKLWREKLMVTIRQWNSMKWSRFTIVGFKTNSEIKIKLK